jgi:glycosyltransferase involved in cell wall biosynthesis
MRAKALSRKVTRMAYLSPMPPAKTGIATYSRAVLAGLHRTGFDKRNDIDVLWPLKRRYEATLPWYDIGIYHLGNNVEFHRDIYRHCIQTPGLVVLHDIALDDFVRGMLAAGDPLGFAAHREAIQLKNRMTSRDVISNEPLRIPWCAHAARSSRGVIVHSEFGKRYLEEFGCKTPVFVVPHPPMESEAAMRRGEAAATGFRSQMPRDAVVVGVFGDLNAAKGIEAVLEAAGTIETPVHVQLVGRRIEGYDIDAVVERSGRSASTTLATDVEDGEFLGRMFASDVVVDLRYPHRGEVSGSLARTLQSGRAAVVSATGTYLDFPDDVVRRIEGGPPRASELARVLGELAANEAGRKALGARAREHMRDLARSEATARGYERAILETLGLLQDPARQALARWAGALLDCGVSEEEMHEGFGLSYIQALSTFARSVG